MQKSLILATIISITTIGTAYAKMSPTTHLSIADKQFLHDTAIDGMTEVKLGEIGKTHASRQEVKDFADKMVKDHTKANESLKKLATKEGVKLPATLDAKHQTMVAKFSKLSGPKFDQAYIEDMVKGHKEVVSSLEKEAENGTPALIDWCKNTLPTIKEHLAMSEKINETIGN